MFTELTHLALIRVSGKDAEKFLQGQLTCDVREVNSQHSSLGAYCNHKGRILAIFRIFFFQDSYYLQLPTDIVASTLEQLKKYAAFSKVTAENVSAQFVQMGYSGSTSIEIIKRFGIAVPMNINDVTINDNFVLIRVHGTQPRFILIGTSENLQELRIQFSQTLPSLDINAWKLLDIAAGIPAIYSITLEMFTPHMVNLPQLHAVSFNKGCYVGQEVIARTQYLGKAKRELSQAYIETAQKPVVGEKLTLEDNAEAGIIIDAAFDGKGYVVLAVMQQHDVTENKDIFFHGAKVQLL